MCISVHLSLLDNIYSYYYRVLTVHGSADEIIPVQDAFEFSKVIPNHKHHIIDGANHCYTEHESELASIVVEFIKSIQVPPKPNIELSLISVIFEVLSSRV